MKLMTRIVSIAGAAVAALSFTVPAASAGTAVHTTGIQVTPLTSSGLWVYAATGNTNNSLYLRLTGGPHGSRVTINVIPNGGLGQQFEEVGVGGGYFQIEDNLYG